MNRTRLAAVLLILSLASCVGPGRGWVREEVVGPSVRALAPYTRQGLQMDPELSPENVEDLELEFDTLLDVLEAAKVE